MGAALKAILDTNILIDFLNGVNAAKDEITRYDYPCISLITWMEILVGAQNPEEQILLQDFLQSFNIIAIDMAVAEQAITLRRNFKIRLPDAIIWATAKTHNCLLVTRNTRDFPDNDPGVRIPYMFT
ncbi:MAG: type II toxin-antitoxin system VapC family toxin [Deltaproteobacteria bacterium]|nr:type II toxin-antitoxin system VapC family toxin [Deltaproteobacteria bacterium]